MNYYQCIGSDHGAVKVSGRWLRVNGLNRIDKTGWERWQGPPSPAIEKALRGQAVEAIDRFPGLRRHR